MKFFISTLLMALAINLSAQKYLYIKKGNNAPKLRISLNEQVTFKTIESTKFIQGIMNDLSPTTITINGKMYALGDVQAFRVRNELLTIGGTALAGGALLFTSLALINRIGSSYSGGGLTTGQWVTAASFFGGGLIMRWLGKRTFDKDKGWNWQVIDLEKTE